MAKTQNKTPLSYLLHCKAGSLAGYLITLLLFASDRILKYYVLNKKAIDFNSNSGFLNFKKNFGIAFSIPLPQAILYILVIAIIVLLASISLKYFKAKKYLLHFFTLLIIAGAASNLIDRLKFGFVIDYIDLKFWPVFNLADVMIISGVLLWIIFLSKKKRPSNIERPVQ